MNEVNIIKNVTILRALAKLISYNKIVISQLAYVNDVFCKEPVLLFTKFTDILLCKKIHY